MKNDAVVRSIGLGHTDDLSSVDGMRKMSPSDEVQMSLSDEVKDENLKLETEKESLEVRSPYLVIDKTKMHYNCLIGSLECLRLKFF